MDTSNLIGAMFDQIFKSPAFIYILIAVNFLIFLWEALPFLPSRLIPIVSMAAGAALFPCFVARATVDPAFPHPIAVLICNGLLAGLAAFGLHKGLISWTRSKWGWPPEEPPKVGLWLIVGLSVTMLLTGCNTFYKSAVILSDAEDAVMKQWATAHNDHLTTPALDTKVMDAHAKFIQAKLIAAQALKAYDAGGDKAAYLAALEAARAAVGPLLELLAPVIAPARLEALQANVAAAVKP